MVSTVSGQGTVDNETGRRMGDPYDLRVSSRGASLCRLATLAERGHITCPPLPSSKLVAGPPHLGPRQDLLPAGVGEQSRKTEKQLYRAPQPGPFPRPHAIPKARPTWEGRCARSGSQMARLRLSAPQQRQEANSSCPGETSSPSTQLPVEPPLAPH